MADDHDALLATADLAIREQRWHPDGFKLSGPTVDQRLIADLAAAVRDLLADYLAALDVIARLSEGWEPWPTGDRWYRDHIVLEDPSDGVAPMSDREWRVFCDAAQRATRTTT
jgi:hypothetical protein